MQGWRRHKPHNKDHMTSINSHYVYSSREALNENQTYTVEFGVGVDEMAKGGRCLLALCCYDSQAHAPAATSESWCA